MFEDIVKERPDIREKLKAVFEEDFRYMREEFNIEQENKEYLDFLTDALEGDTDIFINLYIEEFSIPEIDAIIAWRTSDLGKKYTDFSVRKTNPVIMKHAEELFKLVVEKEMKKLEEQDEKEWLEVREEMKRRAEENKIEDRAWSTEEDVDELTSVTLKHKH